MVVKILRDCFMPGYAFKAGEERNDLPNDVIEALQRAEVCDPPMQKPLHSPATPAHVARSEEGEPLPERSDAQSPPFAQKDQ